MGNWALEKLSPVPNPHSLCPNIKNPSDGLGVKKIAPSEFGKLAL